MGVVAVRAAGFAFLDRVPGGHSQLCLHRCMTAHADLNLTAGIQYRVVVGVCLMAVVAGDIFCVVGAALPHKPLVTLVAAQTLAVAGFYARGMTGAKADLGWVFGGLGTVLAAIAMTLYAGGIATAHGGTVGGLPDAV